MSEFDLLTIGDASLDAFIFPTETETLCQLNDKDCLICFSYGDKIPIRDLEFSIGGNAANNGVGTQRLGIKNSTILTLGADKIGDQIVETLMKEGVDVSHVYRLPEKRSNYSLAINYSGERTMFTYKDEINYKFPEEMPSASWIYLTSAGDDFESIYTRVVDWVKSHPDVKLVFNPGSRQLRVGVEKLKNVLSIATILYINREEAEKLSGRTESTGKDKELLDAVAALGPKIPIITDGVNGSFTLFEGKYYQAGVMPVDSFERTGAGDAFGSGCLAALIKGKNIDEALLQGTVNSASVIGYIGAQKGLLTGEGMQTWMARAKSSGVEVKEF